MYTAFIYLQSLTVWGEKEKIKSSSEGNQLFILCYQPGVMCVCQKARSYNKSYLIKSWRTALEPWPLGSEFPVPLMNKGRPLPSSAFVDRSGTSRLFHWVFFCSFSSSRGQGWEGCGAEATGNCSSRHRQQHTPCGRARDRLSLAVDLLPEQGLGECPPWPGYPGQEPSQRRPGETSLREG